MYKEDLARQEQEKNGGKAQVATIAPVVKSETWGARSQDAKPDELEKIARVAKIVERMVNQNTYDEIAQGK